MSLARRAPGWGGGGRKRAFRRARFFLFVGLGGCGFGCLGRRGKVNKIKVGQTEVDACYHTSWTKGSVNFAPTRPAVVQCVTIAKKQTCKGAFLAQARSLQSVQTSMGKQADVFSRKSIETSGLRVCRYVPLEAWRLFAGDAQGKYVR